MKKIFIVGGFNIYASWIDDAKLVDKLEDADIVLFTGGEDIDPSFYGEKKHRTTYSNISRDKIEKEIFEKVDPKKQICLGICRGSQFLCVMNGGKLIQNVTGHAMSETHLITNGRTSIDITSTHHQMQYPFNLPDKDYTLLYWTKGRRSLKYEMNPITCLSDIPFESEIVLYHKTTNPVCLAIQGHPEMMSKSSGTIEVLNNLLNKTISEIK